MRIILVEIWCSCRRFCLYIQIDSNYPALHNAYAQYTSAGSGQLSSTTESTNYGIGGQTYANQYADQTASYEQTQQQQMPTYDSQQQYYPQTQQADQYATPSYQQVQQDTQQQYQQIPVQPAIQQPYQEQTTTFSAAIPEQQQLPTPVKQEPVSPVQTAQQQPSSNVDLLSGLDFAGANLSITAPPLQPTSIVPAPVTLIPKQETNNIPVVPPVAAPILPASFSLVDDKIM